MTNIYDIETGEPLHQHDALESHPLETDRQVIRVYLKFPEPRQPPKITLLGVVVAILVGLVTFIIVNAILVSG